MGSCRHLFSSVAVMAMVGAACTGGSSDGSVGGQGGAGGTGASNEASAAGSSSSSSSAQGGSAGHSTSHSAAGSGGLRASGGTAGSGGSSSRISSSGGTISSGGTSSSGMAGSGGNSSRTYSSSSYTPRCHNLGTGGMTELTGTFSYTGPIGGAGGTRSSGNVGGTAGSSRSNMGGTTSRNSSGSGGTTGTGDTACTPEQLAVRPASKYTVLGWADLPNDIQTFMTSVLPLSYIQDHIRFFAQAEGNRDDRRVLADTGTGNGAPRWPSWTVSADAEGEAPRNSRPGVYLAAAGWTERTSECTVALAPLA